VRIAAQLAAAIERQLRDSEFLLGDLLTAADIVVGGVLAVVDYIGLLDCVPEPAARYLRSLQGRSAHAHAMERTDQRPDRVPARRPWVASGPARRDKRRPPSS
jgi:glutathione S-transferase